MNDVALAMELLGIQRLGPEHKHLILPLIAKTEGDRKRLLLKQAFESIVRMANRYANELTEATKEAETETEEVRHDTPRS